MEMKIGCLVVVLACIFVNSNSINTGEFNLAADHQNQLELPSDNDIIQEVFLGIFAQNNLMGPDMIRYCFDDQVSHTIVAFVGETLQKAARGSVSDLVQIITLVKEFIHSLPQQTIDCLGKSQQIRSLGFKYNIDESTDFQALQIHVGGYIALHYLQVHRWCVDLNDKWQSAKYYDGGFNAGMYGHKLFSFSQLANVE